jgi:hypothetical protein
VAQIENSAFEICCRGLEGARQQISTEECIMRIAVTHGCGAFVEPRHDECGGPGDLVGAGLSIAALSKPA